MQIVLFAGHRLDHADRPDARFPPAKEPVAREAIREAILDVQRRHGQLRGMAGGASGGDILFHEICRELGIPSELYLAVPPKAFMRQSVASAGDRWIARFRTLASQLPVHVMPPGDGLVNSPPEQSPHADPWERNNLWLLQCALTGGVGHVTVIALWNGEQGDGPGGTDHLVAMAQARGISDIRVLHTKQLFAR